MKAVSDIYSPATGKVLEVNESLKNEPATINKSPEKEAWVAKVTVDKPEEIDSLMDSATYKKFCEEHKEDH